MLVLKQFWSGTAQKYELHPVIIALDGRQALICMRLEHLYHHSL